MAKKIMNHTEYQKRVKGLPDTTLEFIIDDCQEAIDCLIDGENVGYYQDEIHYCHAELKRRRDMKKPQGKYKAEQQCNNVSDFWWW